MTHRFPPLAAPVPIVRRRSVVTALPRWMQTLPLTELLVLGGLALVLAFA